MFGMVGEKGLEPSRLAAIVPKTIVSAIPPLPRVVLGVGRGVEFLPTPFSREVENSVKSVAVKTIWILYL